MATENSTQPQVATAPDVLDKYKAAGVIVQKALQYVIDNAKAGTNILDLAKRGDALIEEETSKVYNKVKGTPKGIAFPTTVSVNNVLQNWSPLPSDAASEETLKANDTVKILLGAHIDGFAVIGADTLVIPESQTAVEGIQAELISAAYNAAEVALRFAKPGNTNWQVTDEIKKVLDLYDGVTGVQSVLSHEFQRNNIEATKGIVAFPTDEQRYSRDNRYTFEEGEVYGLNIQVTSGGPSPKQDVARTTIYQKTGQTYQLKLKTARATYAEITKKAGSFPFTLRSLENEGRARLGVQEAAQHNLLKPFDVTTTSSPKDISAQVFVTFAILKSGVARLSPAPADVTKPLPLNSAVALPEEVQAIIAQPLKAQKKKK